MINNQRFPRKMLFLGIMTLCGFSSFAEAATFYIDNSCSQNGNGISKTCGVNGPWNSLANSRNCNGMHPGDVLEVRVGNGVYREGIWHPSQACNGIIIQNYPGETVVLDGTRDISKSTWANQGNGVYLCTSGTCSTHSKFPFTAWYDTGDAVERRLNLIQSNRTCDTSLSQGEMRNTTGNQLCVRLFNDSSPASADYFRIPTKSSAIQLNGTGVDNLTIRKNPSGGAFKIQRFRDHGITSTTKNTGIVYDGLDIGWVMDRCINQSEGGFVPANYQIINNTIHHCGQEGIRWSNDTSPTALVANNEVYEIQSEPFFERCHPNCQPGFSDNGTGIRVVSHNGTIRHNMVYNIGGGNNGRSYGIDLENGTPGVIVDSNYIYNMNHGLTSPRNGQAILLSSNASESYDGVVIKNNRIHNVDVCIAFDVGNSISSGDTIDIINNTCSDPSEYGLQSQDGRYDGTINVVNNIFIANGTTPEFFIDVRASNTSGIQIPIYNSYFCPSCSSNDNIIRWKGDIYKRDGDCVAGKNCVVDLDSKSHYGDPNLDMNGSPPTLKMFSASGTAYNKGSNSLAPPEDFMGNKRPIGSSSDIGAHEFIKNTQMASPNNLRILK